MPYVDNQKMDAAAYPDVLSYFYRANSIFDPVAAVGGHQPLFHDQLAILYNHYMVVSAKITVKFSPTGTYAYPVACGIYMSDDTTVTTTNITQMLEQPGVTYKYLPMVVADKTVTVSRTFSAKKFFNVSNLKDNKYTLGALFGNDPSEQAYFAVFCGSVDYGGTNPPEIMSSLRIEYNVVVSEPKEIAQS